MHLRFVARVQDLRSSCFLSQALFIPIVIQGLATWLLLVVFGFFSLQCSSNVSRYMVENDLKSGGLWVDSLDDIAVQKLSTLD